MTEKCLSHHVVGVFDAFSDELTMQVCRDTRGLFILKARGQPRFSLLAFFPNQQILRLLLVAFPLEGRIE